MQSVGKRGTLKRQDKVIKCYYNLNNCLIAISHTLGNDGYPQIQRDGKRWRLSRWVFYNNYGFLPEVVMHICDNPMCINPLHLMPGSIKLNSLDMKNKGRAPKGNNQFNGGQKLDKIKVKDIRLRLSQGESLMSLAKRYNVSKRLILLIKQNKKWKI